MHIKSSSRRDGASLPYPRRRTSLGNTSPRRVYPPCRRSQPPRNRRVRTARVEHHGRLEWLHRPLPGGRNPTSTHRAMAGLHLVGTADRAPTQRAGLPSRQCWRPPRPTQSKRLHPQEVELLRPRWLVPVPSPTSTVPGQNRQDRRAGRSRDINCAGHGRQRIGLLPETSRPAPHARGRLGWNEDAHRQAAATLANSSSPPVHMSKMTVWVRSAGTTPVASAPLRYGQLNPPGRFRRP